MNTVPMFVYCRDVFAGPQIWFQLHIPELRHRKKKSLVQIMEGLSVCPLSITDFPSAQLHMCSGGKMRSRNIIRPHKRHQYQMRRGCLATRRRFIHREGNNLPARSIGGAFFQSVVQRVCPSLTCTIRSRMNSSYYAYSVSLLHATMFYSCSHWPWAPVLFQIAIRCRIQPTLDAI